MLKREHRIYFSSAFSQQISNIGHFTVNLPFSLELSGVWKCSILDFYISSKSITNLDYIYILGDFCETSFLHGDKQLPILKKVFLKKREKFYNFIKPLYIPLKQKQINTFELEFLDSDLKKINFGDKFEIECTIHFYKHGG